MSSNAHWFTFHMGYKNRNKTQNYLVFICLKAKFLNFLAAISAAAFERTYMVDMDIVYIFMRINTYQSDLGKISP